MLTLRPAIGTSMGPSSPGVVRVFWPHPALPRLGGSSEKDDGEERVWLVGLWERRGANDDDDLRLGGDSRGSLDVVVAGVVTSPDFSDAQTRLRNILNNAFDVTHTHLCFGELVVLGEVVTGGDGGCDGDDKNSKRVSPTNTHDLDAAACPIRITARDLDSCERTTAAGKKQERTPPRIELARSTKTTNAPNHSQVTTTLALVVLLFAPPDPAAFCFKNDAASRGDVLSVAQKWVAKATHCASVLHEMHSNVDKSHKKNSKSYAQTVCDSIRVPQLVRGGAGFLARGLERKVIPGLRNRHAWLGSNRPIHDSKDASIKTTKWRDACQVFASAACLRARFKWIEKGGDGCLVDDEVSARSPNLRRALFFGRAAQIGIDVFLGLLLERFLLNHRDALVAIASGDGVLAWHEGFRFLGLGLGFRVFKTTKNANPTPPFGAAIRENAAWLMRGSPLGVKLHQPLCFLLGSWAMSLVTALGELVATDRFRDGIGIAIRLIAHCAPYSGASFTLAALADVTTFLTTHVAALHVYSSLLVTLQWAFSRKLLGLVTGSHGTGARLGSTFSSSHTKLEATTCSALALTPLLLTFPTTFAFYVSYLVIHAFTVFLRGILVFGSSCVQHVPLHKVVCRLLNANSFATGGLADVEPVERAHGDGAKNAVYVVTSTPAPIFCSSCTSFTNAAWRWVAENLSSVVSACVSLGRLPVALVPFEPAGDGWGFFV